MIEENSSFYINLPRMLHTGMLLSCLADADYSASATHEDEEYIEKFTTGDGEKATCPDMGSAAQSGSKSNIIAEKAEIVLNLPDKEGKFPRQTKHDF